MGCLMVFVILLVTYLIDWVIVGAAMWIIALLTDVVVSVPVISAIAVAVLAIQMLFCGKSRG